MGPPAQIFESPREPRTQSFLRSVLEAGKLGRLDAEPALPDPSSTA